MPHNQIPTAIGYWHRCVIGISMVATLNGQQSNPGLVVDEVAADSAAAKAGIRSVTGY